MNIADNLARMSTVLSESADVAKIRREQLPEGVNYPKEAALRLVDTNMQLKLGVSLAGGVDLNWLSSMAQSCQDSAEHYIEDGLSRLSEVLDVAAIKLTQCDKIDASKALIASLAKYTGEKIQTVDKEFMSGANNLVNTASEIMPLMQSQVEFSAVFDKHRQVSRNNESSITLC